MASNRYYEDDDRPAPQVQPGISRQSQRRYSGRSDGYGSRAGARRSADRYADRSEYRSASGGSRRPSSSQQRRAPSGQRPPQPRKGSRPPKRRGNGKFYAVIAALAVVLIGVILLVARPGGDQPPTVAHTNTPAAMVTQAPDGTGEGFDISAAATDPPTQYTNIAEMLADTSSTVEGLSADQMVHVEGLSIKEGLPEEWLNVLLLGTDERTLAESARTDAMMICSINRNSGEVKLTSIMRDLAVEYKDIGEYNGTYGINAANFFGGPDLAMKTVNELFDMNVQYYVMINFFGFGIIAQRLGGVEVDISEAEMNKINEDIVKQYKMAWLAGYTGDTFDPEQKLLEQYGENIHLNGNQTLAYARIRHLDGGDYMRTTRQQTVLKKLLGKVKTLGMMDLVQLGGDMFDMVKTNMELEDIFKIATIVIGNGIEDIQTLRLPVANTYKEEVRNEKSLLWDCDFATNAVRLYDFIYE